MTERKDEQWLDAQLRRTIHGSTPVFDAESWKTKHRDEYEALLSRRERATRHGARVARGRWIAGLATAAAIMLTVALLVPGPPAAYGPQTPPQPVADSAAGSPTEIQPADIISFESLTLAFRRGGEEALNRQLDTAQETLGPRPDRSLLSDVLNDIRG